MVLTLLQASEQLKEERQAPTIESTEVSHEQKKQRKKAQLLLDFGDKIERMATKQDQIDDYGTEIWRSEFNRLSTIKELTGINLEGENLRNWIWNQIPNSPFKRFQEAFCKPEDRIIPELWIAGKGIQFRHKPDLNSVKACLADPDCVPDKFLLSLELMDAPMKGQSDIIRLENKYASLSALKKAWESTERFDQKNQRMLILRKPSDEINERYPNVKNPPEKLLGTILYTREYEPKKKVTETKKPARRLVVDVHTSAYSAFRKTRHQDKNYEEREIPDLAELYNEIRTLNEDFDVLWVAGADELVKEELRQRANELVIRGEELLSLCREGNKVRVYELLQTLNEKIEAKKVGAGMSKMVAAWNGIRKREEGMRTKNKFNTDDRMSLEWRINNAEYLLKMNRSAVEKNASRVGITHLALYKDSSNPQQTERDVRGVMRGLRLRLPNYASEIMVRPFSTYIDALNKQSDEMEQSLREGDQERAMDAAILMHVIGKLQAANICIEELKCETSIPTRARMDQIQLFVSSINDAFAQREVFADREPMHIVAVYQPVEAAIQTLNELVQEAGPSLQSDPDSFEKYCKMLRTFLDTFDLETVTRELVLKGETA